MFHEYAIRLIRERWPTPTELAEELFAIFRSNIPLTHNGPITLTQDTDAPPLTINLRDDDTTGGIVINRGGTPINFPGSGGGGGGGTDLDDITWPDEPDVIAVPDPQETPFPLWGVILSKVNGSVYRVRCWAKDPASSPPIATLNVTQGLVDPAEEIPAGTPVIVIVFPVIEGTTIRVGSAYMQSPVWRR